LGNGAETVLLSSRRRGKELCNGENCSASYGDHLPTKTYKQGEPLQKKFFYTGLYVGKKRARGWWVKERNALPCLFSGLKTIIKRGEHDTEEGATDLMGVSASVKGIQKKITVRWNDEGGSKPLLSLKKENSTWAFTCPDRKYLYSKQKKRIGKRGCCRLKQVCSL